MVCDLGEGLSEIRITSLTLFTTLLEKFNLNQPRKVKHSVPKYVSLPLPHSLTLPPPLPRTARREKEGGQGMAQRGHLILG